MCVFLPFVPQSVLYELGVLVTAILLQGTVYNKTNYLLENAFKSFNDYFKKITIFSKDLMCSWLFKIIISLHSF